MAEKREGRERGKRGKIDFVDLGVKMRQVFPCLFIN
jgi:hypothetical protein